jgi:hypothetical protein
MAVLQLALKGVYFDQIKSGQKLEEYRLTTPFWIRRLDQRSFEGIVLTRGYPPRGDLERRLERPWRGLRRTLITHPHFGADPVEVFAIRVNA